MIVRQATIADKDKWDIYVQNHPGASPYHLWAWKESVAESYNHKGYYLIVEDNDRVCGVFPIIQMKLPILKNQLVALPYCDVGGPLADNSGIVSLLINQSLILRNKLGARNFEIRSASPIKQENIDILKKENFLKTKSSDKVRMILEISDSSESLWNGFKSKLRSQISKSIKNGLAFKWGGESDIAAFYAVFSKNMHVLGSPVHSEMWIRSILTNYGDKAKIGLVLYNNQPVGCGVLLVCGKIVAVPWASTLRSFNNLGSNMLLYWNFLDFAARNNCKIFDFGRSTPSEGTYKFKAQWGAEPKALYWYTLHSGGVEKPKEFDVSNKVLSREQLAIYWSKLPSCMANFLGPLIRRHISL